jgi:hypothetical protein
MARQTRYSMRDAEQGATVARSWCNTQREWLGETRQQRARNKLPTSPKARREKTREGNDGSYDKNSKEGVSSVALDAGHLKAFSSLLVLLPSTSSSLHHTTCYFIISGSIEVTWLV